MKTLPRFYYLDHLLDVLQQAETVHCVALGEGERHFIDEFRSLPRLAQATWARMASRRGRYFRGDQLRYDEIGPVEPHARTLEERGFVRGLEERDVIGWLAAQTKEQVLELLRGSDREPEFRASWPKRRLVLAASECVGLADLRALEASQGTTWVQRRVRPMTTIAFLFFGHYAEDLRAIALRDLGLLRTREGGGEATARFASAAEARAAYFFERALHLTKAGTPEGLAEVDALAANIDAWPEPTGEAVRERRSKLLDRLGRRAEATAKTEEALRFYRASGSSHAREREVRLRYAAGETEWAAARLESMIEDPESDTECAFAADFHARKFGGQRTSAATELLRSGQTLALDEAHRHEPECAAARHFESLGKRALVAENRLWHALFGLTFWDLLFGTEAVGFHGEFDWLPTTLRERTFHRLHERQISARLRALGEPPQAAALLQANHQRALLEPNGLFSPEWFDPTDLFTLLASDAGAGVIQMLRAMAEDFPTRRSGYPDLVVLDGAHATFLEVKAEGDSVRREQLVRLRQMREAGLDAAILQVTWRFDPNRIYAVVDLETTGGRAASHRVTEVAIVRVQAGRELSRWSSLVNPERRIPRQITALTGITDAMVQDAPVFADLADEIERQLDGALFVAHNVAFDYGFLSEEFRRLNRPFRHPRLCTVVQMRRHFPGSPSYSLGKLCREHGIALNHHHRALEDAVATSKLTHMIHESRCAQEPAPQQGVAGRSAETLSP